MTLPKLSRALFLPLLLTVAGSMMPARAAAALDPETVWLVADLNGDHKPDLVSVSALAGSAFALPNMQAGPFAPNSLPPMGVMPRHRLRTFDLDGDADGDLVLETLSSVPLAVWINDGTGHFEPGSVEDFRDQLAQRETSGVEASPAVPHAESVDDSIRDTGASRPQSRVHLPARRLYQSFFKASLPPIFPAAVHPRGPPALS